MWRELVGAVQGRRRQRWELRVAGGRAGPGLGRHPVKVGGDGLELAQKGELVILLVGRGLGVLCWRRAQDRPVLRALSLLRLNRAYGCVGPAEAPPGREALGAGPLLGPRPRTPTVGPGLQPLLRLLRSRDSPGRRAGLGVGHGHRCLVRASSPACALRA